MKFLWYPVLNVPPGSTARNVASCKARGLPYVGWADRPPLAIVGGGPSVVYHLEELKVFPGDVWVSGSAFQWARPLGIDATFFTIDQHQSLAKDGASARKAILATVCHPDVFEALLGADVQVFDLVTDQLYATSIPTSMFVALAMGYSDITFYGCDSSYGGTTHAYVAPYWDDKERLTVACGGESYETNPSFLMQAEFMSAAIRMAPQLFKVRGYGLMPAMVESPEYDVTHYPARLLETA